MAEKLRQRGNRQYVLGKYEQAIASYTEAIVRNTVINIQCRGVNDYCIL